VISSLPFTIRRRTVVSRRVRLSRVNHTRSCRDHVVENDRSAVGRDNATTISPGCFDSAQRPVPPRRLLPRARTCVSLRDTNVAPNGHDALDARWFTEPLKRARVFFCRRPRFNWMSLLRRALLSGLRVRSSARPYFPPERSVSLSLSLTRARACTHARTHTSAVRSDPPIRSYIYCIEETRAAAFLAHAPPVMSGLQSCLSFRPSVRRTGRLPYPLLGPLWCPYSGPPRLLPSSSSFLLALLAAFLRSLLGSLAVRSRDCRPGQIRPHLDTHAPRGAPFAPFLRDSFNDRHDRSPLILHSADRNRA